MAGILAEALCPKHPLAGEGWRGGRNGMEMEGSGLEEREGEGEEVYSWASLWSGNRH